MQYGRRSEGFLGDLGRGVFFQEVWGMVYADDTGVVSQSPGSVGNITEVIVKVSTA